MKVLIADMITKSDIEKLGIKSDQMVAAAKLKEDDAELEFELSTLAKAQAELDIEPVSSSPAYIMTT